MAPLCSRYMDSYPHGNQMQYFHPCPPMWGNPTPQMKVEQSESPLTYGQWNYGGNYGYPCPWECHPHGYYNFRPPYTPFPQPPMVCYHRPYPPYPEGCPPYNIPVPHYTAEQPRYEYDKNMLGNLCSRCLSKCDPRDVSGVRIEEHESKPEKKENDALAPMKFDNNHLYPIVWIPSEYMKNKDYCTDKGDSKQAELGPSLWNGRLPFSMKNVKESNEPSKLEPKARNGWFPLDLNSVRGLTQDGDWRTSNQDQKTDREEHLPFPIFWIPASEKPEDRGKKNMEVTTTSPKPAEQRPGIFKLIPVKHLEKNESGDKKVGNRSVSSSKEKEVTDIPVKGNGQNGAKDVSDDTPRKDTPANQPAEIKEKKSSDNNVKRKSPSPPKESKLPPICLRVDPMPKKKNGNCASRYPSPPGNRHKVQEDSNGSSKASNAQAEKNEPGWKPQKPLQEKVCGRKEIEVTEVQNAQKGAVEPKTQVQNDTGAPQEVLGKPATSKAETPTMVIDEGGKGTTVMTEEKPGQDKKEKKSLSATDAAATIQCAYRGYEVRKWEPLKKLKQIGKVREQVNEVRKRIQALESSVEDEKQRVVIGEIIMNLLLQLDTIQGLHPTVREIRKSVARELISLQEKLDSITSRNFEKKEVIGFCETGMQDIDEAAPEHEYKVINSKEESKEIKHGGNLITSTTSSQSHVNEECNRPMEPKHQLGTSSSTADDVVSSDKEEQAQLANTPIESPAVNEEVVGPEAVDGQLAHPSEEPKHEATDVSFKVENANEELGMMAEEPANFSSVVEQKTDSGAKELTGSSSEVQVCQLEAESNSFAELIEPLPGSDDYQLSIPSLSLKDDKLDNSCEKPETNQDVNELAEGRQGKAANVESIVGDELEKTGNVNEEQEPRLQEPSPVASLVGKLSGSSTKAMGILPGSGAGFEYVVAEVDEPVASLLAELPRGVVDEIEKPIDKDLEKTIKIEGEERENSSENIELQAGKDANTALQFQYDGFKPGETLLIKLAEGESNEELNAVSKEEDVDKEGHFTEPPVEARSMSDTQHVDVSNISSEDASSALESQEVKAISRDKRGDDKAVFPSQTNLSDICAPTSGETRDSSCSCLGLEPIPGSDLEKEERKLLNAVTQEDISVKEELANLAPSSEEATEKKIHGYSAADEPQLGSMADDKKLVEENEKLREMLEKLMEAGKQQITAISELHGRVRDLERKLSRKKKMRINRHKRDFSANNMSKREAVK